MDWKNKKILGMPIVLAGILLITIMGATAAIISYFGEAQVKMEVTQAIELQGETEVEILEEVIGPITHNELLTVKNNNNERDVGYTWKRLSPSQAGTMLGVYEVKTIGLYNSSTGKAMPNDENDLDERIYDVVIQPGVDEVTYKFKKGDNHVETIFSLDNNVVEFIGVEYHDGASLPWVFVERYTDSSSKVEYKYDTKSDLVSSHKEIRKLEEDNGDLIITVTKPIGVDTQAVAISIREYGLDSNRRLYTNLFYSFSSYGALTQIDVSNLIDESRNIVASGENEYVFSVFADTNFVEDLFAKVGVQPITYLD